METTSPRGETGGQAENALDAQLPADHYRMLGVSFALRTDSREVRDFFRAAYRRFAHGGRTDPDALRLTAVLDPSNGPPFAAAGDVRFDLSGRPMPVNRAFLFLLNALMDRVADYLLIHGAAVSLDGRGVILAGPPTAGKSTLVLELARRGAAFLSDDVAPVERATGLLHPFPRAIGIRREGEATARFDLASLPPGSVHPLPYKWLVDPAALGLRLPGPADAPCRVATVVLLDGGKPEPAGAISRGARAMEIALAEEDADLVAELRAIPGVSGVRAEGGRPFPVLAFTVEPSARPVAALAELARRRRDLVLYLDEARGVPPSRGQRPELREARWSSLLMEIARELLNRSDSGLLMASCGGLSALVAETGRLLAGAKAYRLTPGNPEQTADLILALAAGKGGEMMKGDT